MEPQVEVHDIVVPSIVEAIATTKRLFGITDNADLAPFMKVAIATRSLNADAHEQVVAPIVEGILESLDLDPANKSSDRLAAEPFAEMIAMAISDATQMIYQQMQRAQQEAMSRAAAGSGQALIGA